MKKILFSSALLLALNGLSASAQTFLPVAGSALNSGTVGVAGYSQTITVSVPTSITVTGQAVLNTLPSLVQTIVGLALDATSTYNVDITEVVFNLSGLPAGLTASCSGCTVSAGGTMDITISGTPTAQGNYTVDLTSGIIGATSLAGLFNIPFGGSFQGLFSIPALAGEMDAQDYTLAIAGPNGISESNQVFGLNVYPNPTLETAMLIINSTESGKAIIEIYALSGGLVYEATQSIYVGANRVNLQMEKLPAGSYMVRAKVNKRQALIRVEKG